MSESTNPTNYYRQTKPVKYHIHCFIHPHHLFSYNVLQNCDPSSDLNNITLNSWLLVLVQPWKISGDLQAYPF